MTHLDNRIRWVDTARGLGILFVIWGHYASDNLADFFYTFHVPLFFVLSGYLFRIKPEADAKQVLRKLSKSLLIPYFSLGAMMAAAQCLINYFYKGVRERSAIARVWTGFLVQNRWTTLWFIAVLFLTEFFFFLMLKFANRREKKNMWLTTVVLICAVAASVYYRLGGKSLPWNLDICPMAILFMHIGYLLRDCSAFQRIVSSDVKHKLLAAVVFLMLNLTLSRLNCMISGSGEIDMFYNIYGFELVSLPCAVCGALFVIMLSDIINSKVITYIGKHSLVYFSLHQMIAIPVSRACIMYFGLEDINAVVYNILMLVLSVSMLTAASALMYGTKLKVLLGKY